MPGPAFRRFPVAIPSNTRCLPLARAFGTLPGRGSRSPTVYNSVLPCVNGGQECLKSWRHWADVLAGRSGKEIPGLFP